MTATLRNGDHLVAQLAVAADGRGSPAREAAGISAKTRALPQAALVLNFKHAREHGFVSTEFHTQSGPCTQVPLPGMRSSLVWVLKPEDAETMNALGDEELSRRVEERLSSMLGRVTVEPGRQIYPLGTLMPSRFGQNRVALVGEAAHVFPPISAQGLNLGIRDVEDLVAVASAFPDDPGSPAAMSRYHAARRPDILARSNSVNLLNASLLSGFLPHRLPAAPGSVSSEAFRRCAPSSCAKACGPAAASPRFCRLREKVRRQEPVRDGVEERCHRADRHERGDEHARRSALHPDTVLLADDKHVGCRGQRGKKNG